MEGLDHTCTSSPLRGCWEGGCRNLCFHFPGCAHPGVQSQGPFCQEPPGGWEGGAGARGVGPMLSAAPVTVQRVSRSPELPSLSADDVGRLL